MKKVLIGLFLVASLSVLGEKRVENAKSKQNYRISIDSNYYAVDGSLMTMYSKEKVDFKNKYLAAEKKDDTKKIIELLKKYVEKYPDDAFAYELIGTKYSILMNSKEAEKYYLKAIELGDNIDTGLYSLALLYNDDDALKSLHLTPNEEKEKLKIRDKYKKELSNTSFTYESLKDLRNHKISALIGNAYSIYKLAIYYSSTEDYKLSEKYAKEFLEFDKENVEILNILSNAYIAQKKYAESEKLFLPLAQKGMMQAQYLLALGYYHAGNLKEAEKWAKKTLEKPERKQSDDIEAAKELLNRINSKLKELNKK